MSITLTLRDQFSAASERFDQERIAYEKELAALKKLEQELLEYTDSYQGLPDQAEYIGEGTWLAFECTFSAMPPTRASECWRYIVKRNGKAFAFEEVQEAVTFLCGYKMATDWHEENTRAKAIAEEQEAAASHLTQPE